MEPASSQALGIAHVVANILHRQVEHFQQVNGHTAFRLSQFALVNKLWADEATEMIWAHLDELAPLERVKPERRQYYAAKIRSLKVVLDPRSPPATACLSGLALPRLREVELMFYYDATLQHIPPVLTSEVRAVTVHFSPRCLARACDYAFEAMMTRCHHLETLKYIGPSRHLDPVKLLSLMSSQRQTLLDVRIHMADSLSQHSLTEDITTHLAERSMVRRLYAPKSELHAPRIQVPFEHLEMLETRIDYRSLYTISGSLPGLKTLRINLLRCEDLPSEPLDPILSRLANSTQLEILKIDRRPRPREGTSGVQTPVTLSGPAFASFAQACRNMKELSLSIQPGMVAQDFTVVHLERAALCFPQLREVALFLTPEASSVAAAAVSIFGRNCPELESCHILGEVTVLDIDWETETVFPNLRRLSLNQIRGQETNWSLDTYDSKLRKKFPRLELLQVMKSFPGPLSAGASYLYDVPRAPRSDPCA
ncbi:hypothetical protein B0J12DRAFT_656271 [Macrophomina phaseolina]|uniref:Uncharacterized protein n=1 Tax=Macrophomina phaseolina TaxID=35725 RepID=A0ABQ8GHI9_9PEZI|nr:hypothetical protein B0J12DRAFT_656271 [Macrophomina phaseolina]